MKIRNISKKILITAIAVMVIPCSVFASSPQLSTDSTGRFEYDSDGDGSQNIILDSGDVDKLSSAENTNASDISVLQSKYASLITSLDSAKSELDSISASGTADASNIDEGMTAVVKGNLITGTRTLAAETPGTATAANISKDKTAWVNGVKITGTGEDNEKYLQDNMPQIKRDIYSDFLNAKTKSYTFAGFSIGGLNSGNYATSYNVPIYSLPDDPNTSAIISSISTHLNSGGNRGWGTSSIAVYDDSNKLISQVGGGVVDAYINMMTVGGVSKTANNLKIAISGAYDGTAGYAGGWSNVGTITVQYVIPQ